MTDDGQQSAIEDPAVISPRGTLLPRDRAARFDLRTLTSAAVAHFVNDFYVAFLAPLLPLVVGKFHLSLTLAGLLATILNTSAAMSQPLFGALADRMHRRVFVTLGPALTVTAMGLMGLAPSYGTLILLLMVAGTGTASFHPQGASTAGYASGQRVGIGMSLFVAGGELGYSLGPVVIALVVAAYGLEATWLVALPGIAACAGLWRAINWQTVGRVQRTRSLRTDLAGALRPLALLWVVVALRSIIILSYITFLPLLLRERGSSIVAGGAAVFLFGGVGAIGGLVGGTIADRIGRRAVLTLSLVLGMPLLLAFMRSQGPWSYLFLAAGGIAIYLSAAITIVMAQELLPQRTSVASSIVMGLAWGGAGLSLTAVGALADVVGLSMALTAVLALGVPALAAVVLLPKQRRS